MACLDLVAIVRAELKSTNILLALSHSSDVKDAFVGRKCLKQSLSIREHYAKAQTFEMRVRFLLRATRPRRSSDESKLEVPPAVDEANLSNL